MRMSILTCVSLVLAVCILLLVYIVNPDPRTALSLLPLLAAMAGIPLLMDIMNRRHVAKLDLRHVKLSKIKDAAKKEIGDQVRVRGVVQAVTNKLMNRPHFQIADDTGEIGVHMFIAPCETINSGDRVETVGALRWSFSFRNREKKIWGLRMEKIESLEPQKGSNDRKNI